MFGVCVLCWIRIFFKQFCFFVFRCFLSSWQCIPIRLSINSVKKRYFLFCFTLNFPLFGGAAMLIALSILLFYMNEWDLDRFLYRFRSDLTCTISYAYCYFYLCFFLPLCFVLRKTSLHIHSVFFCSSHVSLTWK